MISRVFAHCGHQAKSCKNEENEASHLQPQLAKDAQEMAGGGLGSVQDGPIGPAALNLLACNSRGYAQFP